MGNHTIDEKYLGKLKKQELAQKKRKLDIKKY